MALVAGVDSSTQSVKVVVRDAESGALVREGRGTHPDGTEVHPQYWLDALDGVLDGILDGVSLRYFRDDSAAKRVQLITTGFIADLIMRTYYESQDKKPYNIKKQLDI